MKRCSDRARLGFTLLLGLGLALPTPAPRPAAAAAPPNLVPFKITSDAITTDRIVIPGNPAIQAVRVSLSGQSDLLGPVMAVNAHTNHLGVDGLPSSSTDGAGVINGANGDSFFFTYSGLVHPPNPPGVYPYEFAFYITGGTGRFVGATGSGSITGVTDIPHKQATATMEGMISAPGQPTAAPSPPPKLVPFKDTGTVTTDRIVIPGTPAIQAVRASITGQSDLYGPFTMVAAHTNQLGADGLPISSTNGVGVVTTANGDSYFITYSGLVSPPNPPGVFPYEFAFTITGGTGRFAGATGSGTVTGMADIPHKMSTAITEGMISAPKQ